MNKKLERYHQLRDKKKARLEKAQKDMDRLEQMVQDEENTQIVAAVRSYSLTPEELEELTRQEFLLTERGMSYRDALDQCMAAHGLRLQPYLELGSAALLCQMVERGMGLSFLPEYIVRAALAAGTLARLNVPDCRVEMHRQLFYHRDKWLTPQMKGFIALVREGTAQPAASTQA